MVKVAIVGAGLSGLAAAGVLKEHGIEAVLLDKGRSPGGRLATRRIEDGRADHGAQFFTVRTSELREAAGKWLEKGWIKEWYADPHPRYIGTEGMNSLAKRLAENFDVRVNSRVVKVKEKGTGFAVQLDSGETVEAEAVLLTMPAPQTLELLNASGIEEDSGLSAIQFNPCFAALAVLTEPLKLENGHLDRGLPENVERIAEQSAKGISKEPIAVVYMKGEWSKEHFEEEEAAVLSAILHSAEKVIPENKVKAVQLKRWRYAEAAELVNRPFLSIGESGLLLAAGDAFLRTDDPAGRSRFESAYLSGLAAGEELALKLKNAAK
ncbi:NAD(P)/FAD-dependent oxidoreductase [Metabacillus mangrovi]|nr:FAD-dependent oxidoreductase [Metabacillus mangrovi]